MKKLTPFLVFIAFILYACSSDSSEPEIINQTDDEIVVEEEMEETSGEEEEMEEESVGFPFSLSVVMKNFSNPAMREGEFLLINFEKNQLEPTAATNITSQIGLDLDAFIFENGQENVLVFLQLLENSEREYTTYNLDTGRTFSVLNTELSSSGDCVSPGTHIGANANNILAYNLDFCSELDDLVPIIRNYEMDSNQILPIIEEAKAGDSFNRIWATDNHYFFHFANLLENEQDRDGLIVYNANTLEIVYESRTAEVKVPRVDGGKMILKKNANILELIDLQSGQTLFSNTISFSDGLSLGDRIGRTYIHENKVGMLIVDVEEWEVFPGVYDFQTNSSVSFDSETYRDYFRSQGLPIPNPIRQPKEFVFDLESETFAVLYHGFTQGFIQEDNPDFISLVYFNFEGEIIYEYEFDQKPWLEKVVVKR